MKNINIKKETLDTLKFVGVLIVIFISLSLIFAYVPPFSHYKIFAIQTDSMTGVIEPGDVVITKKVNPEDIEVGDIMAFYVDITNDGVDDVVVHFVDEISPYEDQLIYKTSPAVSTEQDRWTIEETDIIGVYVYQVENIGKILLFLQSWIGRVILLLDIIIISVLYDILFCKKNDTKESQGIENKEGSNNKEDKEHQVSTVVSDNNNKTIIKGEDKPKDPVTLKDDMTKMTVTQLKTYAKENKIKGYTKLRKAELIELIKANKKISN